MGKLERKITNEVFIYKIYYKLSSNVSLKKKKKKSIILHVHSDIDYT